MQKFPIKVAIEVSAKDIDDVIHCAIDGAIRYWCQQCSFNSVEDNSPNTFNEIINDNSHIPHTLTKTKVKRGLQALAARYPARFSACFMGEKMYDAEDADVFLQVCLFDEIRYG